MQKVSALADFSHFKSSPGSKVFAVFGYSGVFVITSRFEQLNTEDRRGLKVLDLHAPIDQWESKQKHKVP